MGFRI